MCTGCTTLSCLRAIAIRVAYGTRAQKSGASLKAGRKLAQALRVNGLELAKDGPPVDFGIAVETGSVEAGFGGFPDSERIRKTTATNYGVSFAIRVNLAG